MKTLRSTLLLLCSLLFTCGLSAQTVSGKLVDENQQALPYANVVLLSLPDSAFVAGAVSGDDGTFVLETTSGNQLVKISSIGYKTVYKPVPPTHIGTVQLVSDAQVLGEVVGGRLAQDAAERGCHGDNRAGEHPRKGRNGRGPAEQNSR